MVIKILKKFRSKNFDNRSKNIKIKYIILHFTETKNLEDAVKILCDQQRKVSSHYVIDESGEIYQLINDSKRAWHAGSSFWKKDSNLNDISIGIEIVNRGESEKHCYPHIQIKKLIYLLKYLIKKYCISLENILGHSDIAPTRKIDPGIFFPWKVLNSNSIGMPTSFKKKVDFKYLNKKKLIELLKNLFRIGYTQINIKKVFDKKNLLIVDAFHRHFFPKFVGKYPSNTSLEISKILLKNLKKKI